MTGCTTATDTIGLFGARVEVVDAQGNLNLDGSLSW